MLAIVDEKSSTDGWSKITITGDWVSIRSEIEKLMENSEDVEMRAFPNPVFGFLHQWTVYGNNKEQLIGWFRPRKK